MIITSDYLAQYVYLEQQIKTMERKLKYYKAHPLISEHGVVKGSMSNYPYAECHYVVSAPRVKSGSERNALINQLIIDITGNKEYYEDMKLDIEQFIESIQDIEMKTILQMRYMDNRKYDEIGDALGYDRTTVSKKIDAFIFQNELSHNSHS